MIQDSRVLDVLFDYKNQFVEDIVMDERIAHLITDNPILIEHPEQLIYKQVFPFERIPGTTEDATTYVCCEIDIKDVISKTYLKPVIYIWVFTHESLFRLPEGKGIRYDRLTSEIVRVLSGSRKYGLGELDFKSAKKFSPIDHYSGRVIVFEATDFNIKGSVGKTIPVNRKG